MKHKFGSCADIHLSNSNGCGVIDKHGINSFLRVKERVFIEMIDYLIKYKYKILLICGDWLDNTLIDPPTVAAFHRCLKKALDAGLYLITINGNHESDGVNSILESYSGLNLDKLILVIKPEVIKLFDISFYCIPYVGKFSPDRQYEAVRNMIEQCKTDASKYKILAFHYPVTGCKYDSGLEATNGFNLKAVVDEFGNPFDHILAGDFHDRQGLDGVDNFLYLGQPYWGDFSSIGKKRGFTVFDLDKKKSKLVSPTNCPKFKIIKGISKSSDIDIDLSNKIVKIHIHNDADSTPIYDRGYELGALKVQIKRESIKEGEAVAEVNPNAVLSYEEMIMKHAARQQNMNTKALTTIGLDIYKSIKKKEIEEA